MNVTRQQMYIAVLLVAATILVGDFLPQIGVPGAAVDDWQYTGQSTGTSTMMKAAKQTGTTYITTFLTGQPASAILAAPVSAAGLALTVLSATGATHQMAMQSASTESLGYAAGGAKDIQNFRDNIENGYTPQPTDIPYEGLFFEYYFDTGQQDPCNKMFCPSYSTAVSNDPLSNETEQYMTVGLNSNLAADEFERKKLNLVLVLDISGSMSSSFDQYYYDQYGNRREVENPSSKSKMQVAAESLAALTKHLEEGDRLGVVLFNNNAAVAKPLRLTEETDMAAIRRHMLELRAGGGTNMASGMREATAMLEEYRDADPTEYENRIIFLTDAMPNIDTRSKSGLLGMMEENADKQIYTTFVGIGVDFQTRLIDAITAVEGANSFAVHSADQFKERMDNQFKYMITPLVFNVTLRLDSATYDIKKVYGSTAAEEATDRLLHINTLFPSPTEKGRTRGGVVLAELERQPSAPIDAAELTVTYRTRSGKQKQSVETVTFPDKEPGYFANRGIRKAVLLARYADLMKAWTIDTRSNYSRQQPSPPVKDAVYADGVEPLPPGTQLGQWEQQSVPLTVSDMYQDRIRRFRQYFEQEKTALNDSALQQEVELLKTLENQETTR